MIDHTCLGVDTIPQNVLDAMRGLDVLFGHQSVGYNIMDGLGGLESEDYDRYHLNIQAWPDTSTYDGDDLFGHFDVGANWEPDVKVDDFEAWVQANDFGSHVDVAMMKFCYVDFDEGTGAPADIFAHYRDTMAALEAAYPDVTFVYWTAPLMTDGSARRDEFNGLLRDYCRTTNRPLFDIAAIESHDPSGAAVTSGGREAMYPAYSDDGGHLSWQGQLRVARGLVYLLAVLAGW